MMLNLVTDQVTQQPAELGVPVANLASLILGLVVPFFVSVLSKPEYSSDKRRYIALAASILVGVLNLIVQGANFDYTITAGGVITNLVLVIGASQAAYSTLYKPSGVADKLEVATSSSSE